MWFGVLGPLQVTADGGTVAIGSAKQRRLLAALVLHAGTVVSTDRLIHVLWGEAPPASALQSLRTYAYRLREALGDDGGVFVTRAPGYLLAVSADRIDAAYFEQRLAEARRDALSAEARISVLDEALALWRGPAYAEFADEEFAHGEALRLEELRRSAVEDRAAAQLDAGRHAEVVGDLEAFVATHPLRERAREQLMLALYRCGRQADALAVYHDFRELLDAELGLEVPATLAELERDILRRASHLDPPEHDVVAAPPPAERREPERARAHLPSEPTRLIGREQDIARVGAALRPGRVVTVTGVGGVGKSRVALRVAREAAGAHAGGVWWCELAPVANDADVAPTVATALGARPTEGRTVTDAVVERLAAGPSLFVLDNCEHVLGGATALVRATLEASPETTVLATSRTPLGLAEEDLVRLAPLATGARSEDEHGDPPALELFVERSQAVRPDLEVDRTERAAMVEVCERLDGVPLALELAASRVRSLNPSDLAARLDRRLDLVADARQDEGRHRALRTVVDWSYGLLGRVEQRAFARLAVFAGPFTLEAAEAVAGGDGIGHGEVLERLTALVDHNLVTTLPTGGTTRYVLLETLRAYGLERLQEAGEAEDTRRRHAAHFTALAEDANAQVRGQDEALGVARLDQAIDNLRAAHHWTVANGEVDLAMRLCAALFRYNVFRMKAELFTWAEAVAELPGASAHPDFPAVAGMAGWGAGLRGDLEAAATWVDRGLEALDTPDDARVVFPLEVRMHLDMWQGRIDDCLATAERAAAATDDPAEFFPHTVPILALTYAGRPDEALARAEEIEPVAARLGNPTMRGLVLYGRGEALLETAPQQAADPLEQAADLAAAVDNRMLLGVVDVSLISLQARHGDSTEALRSFTGMIDRLHEAGDWTHLWTGLRGLVEVLARLGCDEPAGVLLGAVRGAVNAPPVYGEDAERLAAVEAELDERLGADAVAGLQARGRALTNDEAVRFARHAIETCGEGRQATDAR